MSDTERYGEYTNGLADHLRTTVTRAKYVAAIPSPALIAVKSERFPAVFVWPIRIKTLSAHKTDGSLRKMLDVQLGVAVVAKGAGAKDGDSRSGIRGSDAIATLVADAIEPKVLTISNGDVLEPCVITDEFPAELESGYDAIFFEVSINAYTIRR
jgi:hypothetical protein